jgi:hypothetical protein
MNKLVFKPIIFFLLLVFSLTAFAQQKKVAVYVTGTDAGINKVLGDQLVAAFVKSGKYIAIERTTSFLAELSKEQNYQRTGAVDDNELSRLGKQFGVQLVCVADVSEVFGQKYVSARLIDVESAEVVNASNSANKSMNNMEELTAVANSLAQELTSKTAQEKAAEAMALIKAQEETEKMLLEGFANGYIKCGDYYAIISYSKVAWCSDYKIAKSCTTGGFTDWRVANTSELNVVKQACRNYYANRDYYTKISDVFMDQLKNIFEGDSFWVSEGSGCTSYYIDKNGTTHYCSSSSCSPRGLMLVRDAK